MDEYEVRVTRQALEQMKEIVHYISYDLMSPAAADNLLDKFKAEILKLSSLPKKYARIEEEPWRTEGIRKMVVQKFLIYYWVDDDGVYMSQYDTTTPDRNYRVVENYKTENAYQG